MEEKQFQQEKQLEKEELKKSQIIQCSCGFENEPGAMFCESCGAGFDQQKRDCPICGEPNSGIYCVFCGTNIDGIRCDKCDSLQYSAFCSGCGEPLSDIAIELAKSSTVPITITEMSEQEAIIIMKDLHDSLTPQMQKEQEKKRQRIILLLEREYFNEREKRIDEFYSAHNKRVKNINPEEMKELKKSIDRLRGYVRSENQRVDNVIKVRTERVLAEAQAKMEAQARVEQERLRNERYHNKLSGVWVATSGTISAVMKIQYGNSSVAGTIHFKQPGLESIDTFIGNWDNDKIFIKTKSMRTIRIMNGVKNCPFTYSALVNHDGDTMNGYMVAAGYWQEIFIKQ